MATKKKAAEKKPTASPKGKKFLNGEGKGNKSEPGETIPHDGKQAWERGESVPCAKNE